MSKIVVDARFRDASSGAEGSGRSKNSRLGRDSEGTPNPRRHALGNPRIGPVVTGSPRLPPTNESRKLMVLDPSAKNLSVIFLRSTRRSPVCKRMEQLEARVNYKDAIQLEKNVRSIKRFRLHLPDNGVPGRDSSENGVELRARTGTGTASGV